MTRTDRDTQLGKNICGVNANHGQIVLKIEKVEWEVIINGKLYPSKTVMREEKVVNITFEKNKNLKSYYCLYKVSGVFFAVYSNFVVAFKTLNI